MPPQRTFKPVLSILHKFFMDCEKVIKVAFGKTPHGQKTETTRVQSKRRRRMRNQKWVRPLAYVTGSVNQEFLLENEFLAAENRILRATLPSMLRLRIRPPRRDRQAAGRFLRHNWLLAGRVWNGLTADLRSFFSISYWFASHSAFSRLPSWAKAGWKATDWTWIL
jgi:hypothetical protein